MGKVIDLDARRRPRPSDAGSARTTLEQLSLAVGRIDELLRQVTKDGASIDGRIESEILAITGALSVGLMEEAVERSSRLADRLQARGARRA